MTVPNAIESRLRLFDKRIAGTAFDRSVGKPIGFLSFSKSLEIILTSYPDSISSEQIASGALESYCDFLDIGLFRKIGTVSAGITESAAEESAPPLNANPGRPSGFFSIGLTP